jgi:hypothetical protein
MDNESEVIRQQMAVTRNDLQDKLETLEQQVKETVQGAAEAANETVQNVTETVNETVQSVSETVQTVKDALQETVDSVKGTVQDTVISMKNSLDLRAHVENHPWPMFIGAAVVGYAGAHLLFRVLPPELENAALPTSGPNVPKPTASTGSHGGHRNGKSHPRKSEGKGFWQTLADHYSDDLAKIQGLAIGAVANVVREMVTSAAPAGLAEQVKEIIDGATTKLGGKPLRGSIFETSSGPEPVTEFATETGPYEAHEARMSRNMPG